MVFKVIIEYWKRDLHSAGREKTEKLIMDYIQETMKLQRLETLVGGFKTGGLGEVKYNIDGTPFNGRYVAMRVLRTAQRPDLSCQLANRWTRPQK